MEVKRQILASQISVKRTLKNEQGLERELSKFFKRLQKEVLSALHEYWSEYQLLQGQINLMVAPVHEAHREYYEILEKYVRREYKLGVAEAKRNVERLRKKNKVAFKAIQPMPLHGIIRKGDPENMNDWFATIPKAEKDLLNRTFRASEQTMSRVDNQINKIITDGYRGGKGINDIGAQLNKRFDQLSSWEARRIARTEVNTSHNAATVDTYRDMGVEYTQWIAANDDRTRDSHAEVDGEIIPMGGKYSNGLEYPGDMSGDISEWINCRCSNAPFVIPYGFMAPSFSPFREEDLIPIETENPLEKLQQEPQITVPTDEQLKSNLTKQELEEVKWARGVQTSEYISDTGKAMARDKLNELYSKALKKPTPKPEKVPPQTVDAKPLKPKTKIVEEQPVKPKQINEVDRINRMTSDELYESMTKADKKKYNKIKGRYETGKKYNVPEIIKHNLLEMRKLEQKQRDKLLKRTQPKQKPKPSPYERTLDNIHKDIEVPTKELIPKLEKWIDKRCDNVVEFGYNFDVKTGKIIGEEIRGKKGHVSITDLGINTGTIHSHPKNGMSIPSHTDLDTFRCEKGQHHFMVSKHEIWYVKATDNFGIGASGQQLDLHRAHRECQERAYNKVAKEIKENKIEATEEAIAEKLNEYTGDEILKTFNSPPWNKTLTVKRYYR